LAPADVDVFFEAAELEKVGKFMGADISAAFADFPLKVADDSLETGFVEVHLLEEFVPKAFPVKAQAHTLAGEAAVQRASLLDALDHELWRGRPANPGTCSMACCRFGG
jgi:hypothetical protein